MQMRKSARTFFAALIVFALAAAPAGCASEEIKINDAPSEEGPSIYECAGIKIAIPKKYSDKLLINPADGYAADDTLIAVYEKAAHESGGYGGFLFSIVRYTEAQYEQFLCSDGSGQSFFATGGGYFYGFFTATDVQSMSGEYADLLADVGGYVRADIISRNGLTAYSDSAFWDRAYTYDGAHVTLLYHPYFAYDGTTDVVWTLTLSQPAAQGAGGIWCVERWQDDTGNSYVYFPDSPDGLPASEYYAGIQSAGGGLLRDPVTAALDFVRTCFGHAAATADAFAAPGGASPVSWESTGDIHDYMPDLLAGNAVGPFALLPCFESFAQATWGELEKTYGIEYFNALWLWLDAQAVGGDQYWRDYYVCRAFLASDGYVSEGLDTIMLTQWHADAAAFARCLGERFSAEERDTLKFYISYDVGGYIGTPCYIALTEGRNLYLAAYPTDFPFFLDLTEQSRENFTAESFGPGAVVDCGGLQVTYLTPYDGVYNIICLRTTRNGDSFLGAAVGDAASALDALALKEVSLLSDDEPYFGAYDAAYVYLPEDQGTSAVFFIVKDGHISGIEAVNWLDGRPY